MCSLSNFERVEMLWIFGECKRNSREVLLKCGEIDSRNESNLPKQRFPLLSMEWHVDKNIVWYVVRIRLGVLYDTVEKKLCVPICFIQSDFDLAMKTNGFRNFFLSIPAVHLVPFNSRSKLFIRQTAVSRRKIVRRVTENTLYTGCPKRLGPNLHYV